MRIYDAVHHVNGSIKDFTHVQNVGLRHMVLILYMGVGHTDM
jgi:hypothetical protein